MAGHAIRVANDGFTALRVAEEWRPEVVLLDIGLPGKDGYQVITELRALPGMTTATIIATTGYGRDEDRARCLAAGFDDHMTKPVNIEQLHRVVGRAVDSGREPAGRIGGCSSEDSGPERGRVKSGHEYRS